MYGDVLELLRHPRPDVCHQALHAAVQCSSQPSFVVYLRHCIKREQETKEGGIGTPSVRRDAKSFSRRVLGLLGSDVDDGALSAAAVEILINLSADDVLGERGHTWKPDLSILTQMRQGRAGPLHAERS